MSTPAALRAAAGRLRTQADQLNNVALSSRMRVEDAAMRGPAAEQAEGTLDDARRRVRLIADDWRGAVNAMRTRAEALEEAAAAEGAAAGAG